jgi:hypothetical protein
LQQSPALCFSALLSQKTPQTVDLASVSGLRWEFNGQETMVRGRKTPQRVAPEAAIVGASRKNDDLGGWLGRGGRAALSDFPFSNQRRAFSFETAFERLVVAVPLALLSALRSVAHVKSPVMVVA